MGNDWIIGVLADLKNFAQENDLPLLAVQLDEANLVAEAEIAQRSDGASVTVRGESTETGSIFAQAGASRGS